MCVRVRVRVFVELVLTYHIILHINYIRTYIVLTHIRIHTYIRPDKKTGELCKYANACFQGPLHAATKFWDNTGTFPVQRLDPKWNLVDL